MDKILSGQQREIQRLRAGVVHCGANPVYAKSPLWRGKPNGRGAVLVFRPRRRIILHGFHRGLTPISHRISKLSLSYSSPFHSVFSSPKGAGTGRKNGAANKEGFYVLRFSVALVAVDRSRTDDLHSFQGQVYEMVERMPAGAEKGPAWKVG